jgi:hypothetical protein
VFSKSDESITGNYKKPCGCGCGKPIWHFAWRNPHQIQSVQIRIRNYSNGHNIRGKKYPKKVYESRRRTGCHFWNGGRKMFGPYVAILRPEHKFATSGGYVREHWLVWEEYYKACLLSWSVVHHINGIKTDNKINNLQAMTRKQHEYLEVALIPRDPTSGKFKGKNIAGH